MSPAVERTDRSASWQQLGDSMLTVTTSMLDSGLRLEDALAAFETRYLATALSRCHGNLTQTAEVLGIHRNTLRAKLRRNGSAASRRDR